MDRGMQGYKAAREPTAHVNTSKRTGTGHLICSGLGAQGVPVGFRRGRALVAGAGSAGPRGGEDGSDMSRPAVAVQVSLSLRAREPHCPWG